MMIQSGGILGGLLEALPCQLLNQGRKNKKKEGQN